MLAPKYRFRVDWGALDVGAFTVGASTIGGADAIVADDAGFNGTFSSPYADVADDVLLGKIQRKIGADGICEGTLDLTLTDSWPGKYNAKNPGTLVNLLDDPGFKGDLKAWTAGLVKDSTHGQQYGGAAKMTASGSNPYVQTDNYVLGGLIPGQTYTFSMWVYVPSTAHGTWRFVFYQHYGGAFYAMQTLNVAERDQWVRKSVTGTLNASADEAFGRFEGVGATVGDTAWVAAAQLEPGPSMTDYIDGDQLDGRWAGAANASQSYRGAPLYGEIRPGLRVEGQVSFDGGGTWNGIYVGWLNETESEPDYGTSQARINFTDMAYLSRPIPAIASTGPITVSAALDLVHDAVGWLGARDFRSDTMLSDFSTDGSGTGRDAVAEIIKVDLGFYYVSRDFTATYVDRYEYARRASVAAVQSMGVSVPGVALSTIVNLATATGPSGTPQTYEDSHSNTLYGPLPDQLGNVQSDWFRDDAAALGNAQWRVITQKDPTSPYWQFQPLPADDATLADCILTDVLDVVTVEPVGLPAEDQQAQWVIHDFGGGQAHFVTWRLREKPAVAPLLVGTGTVGSTDVVAPG